jgi:hypothetical protein
MNRISATAIGFFLSGGVMFFYLNTYSFNSNNSNSSNVCFSVKCSNNITLSVNTDLPEVTSKEERLSREKLVKKIELKCVSEKPDKFLLTMLMNGKTKTILNIDSGTEVWGSSYEPKVRCEQIKAKAIYGMQKGARGWATGFKNGYPIICSSITGSCLVDSNGEVMEVATFRKGVEIASVLKKIASSISIINTSKDSDIFTFE